MNQRSVRVALLVAGLCICQAAWSQTEGQSSQVRLIGIQVAREGYAKGYRAKRAFSSYALTRLAFVLELKGSETLLAFDKEASAVTALTDDKDTDMAKDAKWESYVSISKDGKAMLARIESKSRPGSGATRLTVEGTLAATVGGGKKTTVIKDVAFTLGRKLTFDKQEMSVTQVRMSGKYVYIGFEMNAAFDPVVKMSLKDANGKSYSGRRYSWYTRSGKTTVSYRFQNVEKMPEKAEVTIEHWTGLRTVKVPIKLSAGLGLD